MMLDDYEKPKKKKKTTKNLDYYKSSSSKSDVKVKPIRNFQIIDDDIDFTSRKNRDEDDALADLLEPEGPSIAGIVVEKRKEKTNVENKWVKIDLKLDDDDDNDDIIRPNITESRNMFKKRGERRSEMKKENENNDDNEKERNVSDEDSDLDSLPRRRPKSPELNLDDDGDISPVRRKPKEIDNDDSYVDETKVRVRRKTKEEERKKEKQAERNLKYMEWGKGLVQQKEKEEKLKANLYEAEKPLARYKDDKDLDSYLKNQEREDDPMLAYMRNLKAKKKNGGDDDENENDDADLLMSESMNVKAINQKYRGPPPPPNRYNLMPGPRWDGVDRSNGFEKTYFDSIINKKAMQEAAYKWSVEDM